MNILKKILLFALFSLLVDIIFHLIAYPFHQFFNFPGEKVFSENPDQLVIENLQYKTIKLGSSSWLAENLSASTFKDGRSIIFAKNKKEWDSTIENNIPAYTYYNFDTSYESKYGKIYNYAVVADTVGIAPNGWEIPSKTDYYNLLIKNKIEAEIESNKYGLPEEIEGENDAEILRSNNTPWNNFETDLIGEFFPIDKGTNETGFTALPGGLYDDTFLGIINSSAWWGKEASVLKIYEHESILLNFNKNKYGCYIRLIKR